jgi:cyclohexyl-isocyanide hydratase
MMGLWGGTAAGQLTELSMEYAPRPPFGTGLPELAPPEILARARAILDIEMPNALVDQAAIRRGFI